MSEGRTELPKVSEEQIVEEVEVEEEEVQNEPESVRDTVERVLAEAEDAEEEAGSEPEAEDAGEVEHAEDVEEPEATQEAVEEPQEERPPAEYDEVLSKDIDAPARFNAQQKEAFNKAPKNLKVAISQMVKEHEGQFTRTQQEYKGAIKESERLVEAVRPYLLANPDLQKAGYTESALVSGLIGSHQRLRNEDTRLEEFVNIGRNIGIDEDILEEIAEGAIAGQSSVATSPEFQALQKKYENVESYVNRMERERLEADGKQVVDQMTQVQMEQNADGSYRYPELHDAAFIDRLKPLVSNLVEADPQIGYGEALKRAYGAVTGKGYLNGTQRAGLPAASTQQNERATQAAAISVRGRSTPKSENVTQEIPPEAMGNASDSVRWALKQLKG